MAQDKILGVIPSQKLTDPTPQGTDTTWEGPEGQVSMAEPPPPWEINDSQLADSDAKRFVTVPANWTLRWINPRLIDQFGWRDWQAVMASDPRVKVLAETMIAPEGYIRRGGANGDILAWMFTSWVESRRRIINADTEKLSQSAVDRQRELREDFARGKYGQNIRLTESRHPVATTLRGRVDD